MRFFAQYPRVVICQYLVGLLLFVGGFWTYSALHRMSQLFVAVVGGILLVVSGVTMGVINALNRLPRQTRETNDELNTPGRVPDTST
jgi:hypothetical protein